MNRKKRWVLVGLITFVGLLFIALPLVVLVSSSKEKKVTEENLARLHEGMTLQDVEKVLGPSSAHASESDGECYFWSDKEVTLRGASVQRSIFVYFAGNGKMKGRGLSQFEISFLEMLRIKLREAWRKIAG
jgi:hypothetical protein